ncbi:phosphate/phosphite/phosphonate ABC transporter substrate-binding protein [Dongia sedimenti]|uniref:PhnD/SsuA/transferrin family substrate-binding protein n=1 Tax=Dongia sedimenti TaxID=3064282 RepID=A0ABU0YJI8_9PROT|nr:PhnD/SsuA/transferrin family substrate-binding protein [Rhodospirillaceae bacterium R-7]
MFASLGMYDLPELAAATDAWWAGLSRHFAAQGLRDLPAGLTRTGDPVERLKAEGLIFGQTCGFPLTHRLMDHVQVVATPRYAVPGCAGATYVSWIVVRRDDPAKTLVDLRGRRVAYNDDGSQSGYNTLRAMIAPLAQAGRFFGAAIESGAHRRSLAMVKAGEADVAAIDCVTFALVARVAPEEVRGIRILLASGAAPGLLYVTASSATPADLRRLQAGLVAACADPDLAATRSALCLDGCEILPRAAYEVIPAMESAAIAAGYPRLA